MSMNRTVSRSLTAVAAAAALALLTASPAMADATDDSISVDTGSSIVEVSTQPGFVLNESTRIATPDGLATVELSDSKDADIEVGALRACIWYNSVATVGGYTNSVPGCSIIGSPGFFNTSNWERHWAATGTLCAQARGYTSLGAASWNGAGCGTSGGVTYHWGNTASTVLMRAQSTVVHNVAYIFQ